MIPLKLADGGPYPTTVPAHTKHVYLVAANVARFVELALVLLVCLERVVFCTVQITSYWVMTPLRCERRGGDHVKRRKSEVVITVKF